MIVLQRLVINDVNDWHHKCLGILLDSEKQLVIYKVPRLVKNLRRVMMFWKPC